MMTMLIIMRIRMKIVVVTMMTTMTRVTVMTIRGNLSSTLFVGSGDVMC